LLYSIGHLNSLHTLEFIEMLSNSFGNLTFVHLIKINKDFDMGQFEKKKLGTFKTFGSTYTIAYTLR
jgi:hypothetical protein